MKHSMFKRSIAFMMAVLMVFSSATVDVSATESGDSSHVISAEGEQVLEVVEQLLEETLQTETEELVSEESVTEPSEMAENGTEVETEQSEETSEKVASECTEDVIEETKTENVELEKVGKEEWDVVLSSGSCTQRIDTSEIRSSHPYESYTDQSWEVVCEGANAIEIDFNANCELAEGDLVIVYNSQNEVFGEYDVNTLQSRYIRVEGDRLTIRLLNEDDVTDWGFQIYRAYGDFHSWDDGVVTKEADGLCPGERTYTCAACENIRTETIVPDGYEAAGICGDDMIWLLDSEGVLTIQGTGEMYDSTSTQVVNAYSPWEECQEKIKKVIISEGVTSIGAYSFALCSKLSEIVIPEGVTTIGAYAFLNAKKLTSITLPSTLNTIKTSAFANCNNLETVYVPSIDAWLEMERDNAYAAPTAYGAKLYLNGQLATEITEVIIKDGVEAIGANAFSGWTALTSVTIPDSCISIGNYAFNGCTGLTAITIPDSCVSIGSCAFNECTGLKDITLPLSSGCYSDAFTGCTNLKNVTLTKGMDGKTHSTAGPWNVCEKLNITIAEGVETISGKVFEDAYISNLYIPNSLKKLYNNVFYDAYIGNVYYPSLESILNMQMNGEYNNPLRVASYEYVNGTLLEEVVIPDGIEEIGDYVFAGSGIKKITIPSSVKTIGYEAFLWSGLKTIEFAEGLISIGAYAFSECNSLSNITLPDSLEEIGRYAFHYCYDIEKLKIPEKVTKIQEGTFFACGEIELELTGGITSIGSRAFFDTSNVTIKVPSIDIWCNISFSNAEANPLHDGGSLYVGEEKVTSLVLPDTLTILNDYAFYNYTALESVTIPTTLAKVGTDAFYGCTGLTRVDISDFSKWNDISFENEYSDPMAYATELYCNDVLVTDLIIPEGTTVIGAYEYQNYDYVKNIVIPNTVTEIGNYAFADCTGITSIVIPESVTAIGDYAFSGCESLKEITMPYSAATGTGVFTTCNYVEKVILTKGDGVERTVNSMPWNKQKNVVAMEVTVGEGITSIRDKMFWNAVNLVCVELPEGITTIGEYAFLNCNKLESLTLPTTVTTFKKCAFANALIKELDVADMSDWCDMEFADVDANPLYYTTTLKVNGEVLEDYVISEGEDTIKENTFPSGEYLNSVTIPHSVTSIEENAISSDFTLKVYEESYAENYAKENEYTYESLHNNVLVESVESTCYVKGYDRYICSTCEAETVIERILEHKLGFLYELSNGKEIYGCVYDCGMTKEEMETEPTVTGTCGTDLTWKLYGDKILVIEGTGAMDAYDLDALAPWSEYEFGYCVIKEGVTTVGATAFDSSASLEYIYWPKTLETIGAYAFYGCSSMKEIMLPKSLTTIEESAFEGCSALEKATIYEYVSEVDSTAFDKCKALTIYGYQGSYISTYAKEQEIPFEKLGYYGTCGQTIEWYLHDGTLSLKGSGTMTDYSETNPAPWSDLTIVTCEMDEGINHIGNYAFAGMTSLTSIALADTVQEIGNYAFYGCTGLKNVELPEVVNVYGDYAFAGCSGLTEITIPMIEFEMGHSVFENCTSLTKVAMQGTPISMGASVFAGCTALSDVTFSYISYIEPKMFYGCSSLASITLPYGVIAIYASAFEGCKIAAIELPETLTAIGARAFAKNPLESITLPDSVTQVSAGAFAECENFTAFVLSETNTNLTVSNGVLYNAAGTTLLQCPTGKTGTYTMSRKTTAIGAGAFYGCTKLESIVMPNGLESIGTSAFAGTLIKIFEIPASVTSIDFTAFDDCSVLENIIIDEDSETYLLEDSAIYSKDKTYYYYYLGNESEIMIADSVTKVDESAFKQTEGVITVYFPVGITSLGSVHLFDGKTWIPAIYENCTYLRTWFKGRVAYQSRGYAYLDWDNTLEHSSLAFDELQALVKRNGGVAIYTSGNLQMRLEFSEYSQEWIDCYLLFVGSTASESVTFTLGRGGVDSNLFSFAMQSGDARYSGKLVVDPATIPYSEDLDYFWDIKCYSSSLGQYIDDPDLLELADNAADTVLFGALKMMKLEVMPDTSVKMKDFGFLKCDGATNMHTLVSGNRVEPTCTEDGRTADRHCSLCYASSQRGEILPATGHTEIFDLAVEVTCTTDGLTEGKHCTVCEKVLIPQEVIPATGHTEVIDEAAVEATCTTDGNTVQSHCSVCEEILSEKEVIPAFGHTKVVDIEAVEATCTTEGLSEGSHCSVCEEVLSVSEPVEALGHDYDDGTVVEPTCTEEGYTTYVCENCQDEKIADVVEAVGHTYDEGTIVAPTCTAKGYTIYACVNCDDEKKENVVEALGHTVEVLPGKEATETEPGMTGGTWCSVCEEILENPTEIPALGFAIIYHLAGSVNVPENPKRYFADSERITLAAPTFAKAGYRFAGWYLDEEYEEEFKAIETGSTGMVEVYAKWIPYTYTVILTDGSGTELLQSFTYGVEQALKKNSFKKAGNVFAGWALTEGATEADFADVEVVDDAMLCVEAEDNNEVTKVLYAVWKDTYTVTYMGDDYELTPEMENYIQEYKYGKACKLPIPEKEGYVFGGWYKDETLKKKVASITNKMAEDLTLYAKWTPCSYNVKFNANAAAYTDTKPTGSMKNMAMKYDVTATLLANKFVLKGYEFKGWSLADGKAAVVYTDLAEVENLASKQKATVTLYAQWEETPYTIVYDTNGGYMDKDSEEYWYGEADGTVLPTPERDGYDFAGWYKDAKFKKAVSKNRQKENILTKNDFGDMTLYAKWTGKKYDVVFDADTEVFTGKMNTQKGLVYGTGKALTKNGFKRNGYAFAGWSIEPASQEAGLEPQQRVDFANGAKITGLDTYRGSITLYAVWDNQYTATFNAGDGTFEDGSAIAVDEYIYTEGLLELPVPERDGYDFAGWYRDAKFKKAVKKDSKSGKYLSAASDYGDMELYAKWTGKKYNVVFNADASDAAGKTNPQKNLVYGTAKALTKNGFKRTGYVFIGWSLTPARDAVGMAPEERVNYTNAEKVTGFGDYTSNVTLYAVWDNCFDVTIHGNGGIFEDGETEQTFEYIYTEGVSLPTPSREGYDFAGWYYDAKCKKAAKFNQTKQKYLTAASDSKDLELYAKWTGSKYNLTFDADADGITGKTAMQKNRVYGTAKALTKNGFKRAGYKFLGWSLEPISRATEEELANPSLRVDFLNAEKAATIGAFAKETTLYAVWEKEEYKITYMNMSYFGDAEDLEEAGHVTSYTVDDEVVLKRPERMGYTFLGWYTDKNCKKRAKNIEVGTTGNKVFYAKWKLNK